MTIDRSGCAAPKHGDENAYTNHRCTCDDARNDRRVKEKRRREGRHVSPYVDVTGTSRRLKALAALGWSREDLAAQLGCSPQLIERHRTGRLARLHTDVAARYADLYERLQGTPGPSNVTRGHATRQGWAPPLAWDDIDDPHARPAVQDEPTRRGRVDVDEVKFLESCRVSRDDIAARLGVAVESIDRAVHRAAQRARTENMIARAREAADAAPVSWASAPTLQRALNEAFGDDHAMAH